jgi:UDP-2,4-diacetamido-2,4,6-trideoxy-beta-L-altropyranose hydrolase
VILIRTDASIAAGTGHAMRCLALTQALRDTGGAVTLAAASLPPTIAARYGEEGADLARLDVEPASEADAEATRRLAEALRAEWLVVDGYAFQDGYIEALSAQVRVLLIDDFPRDVAGPALLLNQNPYAHPAEYPQLPPERLLLGPEYALLRREFATPAPERRSAGPADRVLVTLGGTDPQNVTTRVVAALAAGDATRGAEVRVVIGAAHPDVEALERASHGAGFLPIRDTRDMLALEDWADVAIASAGTTSLELASRGVPTIHAVLADNQVRVAAEMVRRGVALSCGEPDDGFEGRLIQALEALQDGERRAEMSVAGRRLVDGRGAARVAERLSRSVPADPS